MSRVNYNGLNILFQIDEDEVFVKASAGKKELGHAYLINSGDYLMPQDLEVKDRYQGQGIAKTLYDFITSKGYKIRRSNNQTPAGAAFWNKHNPESNIWLV